MTLAETRSRIKGNSKSHEPSSARKQKHYRREPLPVLASVLQMCLLSLLDTTYFNEKSPELASLMDGGVLLILLSGACDNNDLPYDASIIRLGPMQLESSPHDLREVARIKSLSEGFESGNLHSMSINISSLV